MALPSRPVDADADPGAGGPTSPARLADRVSLVVVPSGLAVAFAALVAFQPRAPTTDVQLIAPSGAPAGASVGLRALVFRGLGQPSGPELVDDAAVEVRLRRGTRDHPGPVVARARMTPTPFRTHEATLAVPRAAAPGPAVLVVRAAGLRHPTMVPFRLGASAPVVLRGREAAPLSQFRAGPVRAVAGQTPPDRLSVRVAGGACVPEVPCRLWIDVGEPPAQVALDVGSGRAVEAAGDPAPDPGGGLGVDVVVHGPEATLTVLARRAPEGGGSEVTVARREVRLPVAVGAPSLEVEVEDGAEPGRVSLVLAGVRGREGALVDLFRDDRWVRATSVAFTPDRDGRARVPLPGGPLEDGLWRVQVRVDRFELGLSASRLHRVGDLPDDGETSFSLADRERELVVPPAPRTDRPRHVAATRRTRWRLRGLTAALFLLAGVWVATWVGRRAIRASAQAAVLMDEVDAAVDEAAATREGDGVLYEAGRRRRPRRDDVLVVIGVVSVVALAFAAGALIVLALGALD